MTLGELSSHLSTEINRSPIEMREGCIYTTLAFLQELGYLEMGEMSISQFIRYKDMRIGISLGENVRVS